MSLPAVAPHAGAWIETWIRLWPSESPMVAPHAGAGIETPLMRVTTSVAVVAPHAGAWIETSARRMVSHIRTTMLLFAEAFRRASQVSVTTSRSPLLFPLDVKTQAAGLYIVVTFSNRGGRSRGPPSQS